VSAATGHRIRWTAVWALVAAWFVALALNVAGNLVHLLLLGAIGILVYELLVEDDDHRGASPPESPPRSR
jgi:hypothetical protein